MTQFSPALTATLPARARTHLLHAVIGASSVDPRLSHLPLNSLALALSHLDARALARCAAVCRRFRDTLALNECWAGAAAALGA